MHTLFLSHASSLKFSKVKLEVDKSFNLSANSFLKTNISLENISVFFVNGSDAVSNKVDFNKSTTLTSLESGPLKGIINTTSKIDDAGLLFEGEGENGSVLIFAGATKNHSVGTDKPFYIANNSGKNLTFGFPDHKDANVSILKYNKEGNKEGEATEAATFDLDDGLIVLINQTSSGTLPKSVNASEKVNSPPAAAAAAVKAQEDQGEAQQDANVTTIEFVKDAKEQYYTSDKATDRTKLNVTFAGTEGGGDGEGGDGEEGKDDVVTVVVNETTSSHPGSINKTGSLVFDFKQPYGYFAPDVSTVYTEIKVELFNITDPSKNMTSTYRYNATNPLRFVEAGENLMKVTMKVDKNGSATGNCLNVTRRFIGYGKELNITVKEGEKVLVNLWKTSSGDDKKYEWNMTNIEAKDITDYKAESAKEAAQDAEAGKNNSAATVFKVLEFNETKKAKAAAAAADGGEVKVGSIIFKNDGEKETKITTYTVSKDPVVASKNDEEPKRVESDPVPPVPETQTSGPEGGDNNNNGDNGSNKLTEGAIAGIVIGCVAAVAIIGCVSFMAIQKKGCFTKKVEAASASP